MSYLEKAKEKFSKDLFATEATKIEIKDAKPQYSKCYFKVLPCHLNAMGFVMGGAIFTLADFAFAVASNYNDVITVSLNSQINYINAAKAELLIAQAVCIKEGKTTCFYEITIFDDTEKTIAKVTTTGFIKRKCK
ncbi:MAG: PaaI family thioesterase [Oscillospiraceae bacterium]